MADLGAIRHQLEMLGFDVFPAHLEAVLVNHVLAHVVAFRTGLDTLAEIVAVGVAVSMAFLHSFERFGPPYAPRNSCAMGLNANPNWERFRINPEKTWVGIAEEEGWKRYDYPPTRDETRSREKPD